MAYLKPPFFVRRVFNPLAMRLGLSGTQSLVVPRRKTGEPQVLPVIPVEHEGSRYIVSTRGESDWVKNLRAAGGHGEIRRGEWSGPFQATEIPPDQAGPIIAAYRRKAGKTVEAYWSKLPDDADHPTFRIDAGGEDQLR
jgi:deazaflavin-dependent oxidoreductase (nitroreductase family)